MLFYYFKIATQRIIKNPLFASVNVIALSIGISAFYILFIHVLNEKSFDKHFDKYENIYRVISTPQSTETPWARSLGFIKDASIGMPEVENACQFTHCAIGTIEINNISFKQNDIMSVDTNFVRMFEVESVVGDLSEIAEPNTVFITEEFAEKHFKNEDPIGKTINIKALQYIRDLGEFQIKGVVKNTHPKTHFAYQILISQKGALEQRFADLLTRKIHWVYNYVQLNDQVKPEVISDKLQKIYNESSLREVRGPQDYNFSLIPLTDIHLKSDYRFELKESISKINISLFITISFVILLISLLNFNTLNFANLIKRSSELDVNRVFGAFKHQIIGQVLVETVLLTLLSIAISLIGIELLKPTLNQLFDIDFSIYYSEPVIYLSILGVLILCSVVSVLFVTFFLFRNSASTYLLADKKYSGKLVLKTLLVVQTAIVIILLSSAFVVNKQISFISAKSLGFNKQNVVVLQLNDFSKDPAIFADELKKQSQIENVGFTRQYFGYPTQSIDLEGFGLEGTAEFVLANFNYLETMDIPLTHNWILPTADTIEGLIVNEHLYNRLLEKHGSMELLEAFQENQNTESDNIPVKIIGVAKDFNYNSAHEPIGDFAFYVDESPFRARFIHIRINPGDLHQTLSLIEQMWRKHYNNQDFNYFFIDDKVSEQYKGETILRRILTAFSLLGILICVIGISAFSLFISQQKTKEIGIRKVNGASTKEILFMLNKEFIKWVAVAFILAIPIGYYLMDKWMDNFAYKTVLSWWLFALAGVATLFIALATVSIQSYKTARRNPVYSLKDE